jgi:hypothetical protein
MANDHLVSSVPPLARCLAIPSGAFRWINSKPLEKKLSPIDPGSDQGISFDLGLDEDPRRGMSE